MVTLNIGSAEIPAANGKLPTHTASKPLPRIRAPVHFHHLNAQLHQHAIEAWCQSAQYGGVAV